MDSVKIDLFLTEVKSDIKSDSLNMVFGLDAMAEFSLLMEGDSSFIRKKHLKVQTDVVFDKKKKMLNVQPTTIGLEKASFDIQGNIDFSRDVFLDLKVSGDKPNFDLFLALAPNELKPVLDNYNNRGRIFFDTIIKGSCINGQTPAIDAKFGCQEGFVENVEFKKEMRDLAFSGYFTNGSKRTMETMEFGLNDFTMRPEVGVFSGSLKVKNFIEPDIDLKLHSDFDLNFITKFFGLKDYYDLQGKVLLTMNFHDIIDLAHPEKSIEKLNESYYTELKVENLKFVNANYPLPIHDFDLDLKVDGHYGHLDVCDLHIGKSDIKIKGSISDFPAI
jgi:hypothetical protein